MSGSRYQPFDFLGSLSLDEWGDESEWTERNKRGDNSKPSLREEQVGAWLSARFPASLVTRFGVAWTTTNIPRSVMRTPEFRMATSLPDWLVRSASAELGTVDLALASHGQRAAPLDTVQTLAAIQQALIAPIAKEHPDLDTSGLAEAGARKLYESLDQVLLAVEVKSLGLGDARTIEPDLPLDGLPMKRSALDGIRTQQRALQGGTSAGLWVAFTIQRDVADDPNLCLVGARRLWPDDESAREHKSQVHAWRNESAFSKPIVRAPFLIRQRWYRLHGDGHELSRGFTYERGGEARSLPAGTAPKALLDAHFGRLAEQGYVFDWSAIGSDSDADDEFRREWLRGMARH